MRYDKYAPPFLPLTPRPGLFDRLVLGGGSAHEAGSLARRLWAEGQPAFGLRSPERWAGIGRRAWMALTDLHQEQSARSTFALMPSGRATAEFEALCAAFKDHRQAGRRFGVLAAWEAPAAGLSVAAWFDESGSYGSFARCPPNWAMDVFKKAGCNHLMAQDARGPEALIASLARPWEFATERNFVEALAESANQARACLEISASVDRSRLEHLASQDCQASSSARFMELIDAWLLARDLKRSLPDSEPSKPRASMRL